jgi:hypothetical protein
LRDEMMQNRPADPAAKRGWRSSHRFDFTMLRIEFFKRTDPDKLPAFTRGPESNGPIAKTADRQDMTGLGR